MIALTDTGSQTERNIAHQNNFLTEELKKGTGRVLLGIVVGNKREKTVTVLVSRKFKHPLYGKMIKRTKKYHAHTENKIEVSKAVSIKECRPISKTKSWVVM